MEIHKIVVCFIQVLWANYYNKEHLKFLVLSWEIAELMCHSNNTSVQVPWIIIEDNKFFQGFKNESA